MGVVRLVAPAPLGSRLSGAAFQYPSATNGRGLRCQTLKPRCACCRSPTSPFAWSPVCVASLHGSSRSSCLDTRLCVAQNPGLAGALQCARNQKWDEEGTRSRRPGAVDATHVTDPTSQKPRRSGVSESAAEWGRTITGVSTHKALNHDGRAFLDGIWRCQSILASLGSRLGRRKRSEERSDELAAQDSAEFSETTPQGV